MKSSLRKFWVLLALAAVSTMILLSIMALRQEREPSEKRLRLQRIAASQALVEQEEVSPPWAYPLQALAFPACTFQPDRDGYDYQSGIALYFSSGAKGYFHAPIILPDYTQIKRVILFAWDGGPSEITLELLRTKSTGASFEIISVSSTGMAASYRRFLSPSVSYTVRNELRSQSMRLVLPGDSPGLTPSYVMLMAKILYKNCYWPT